MTYMVILLADPDQCRPWFQFYIRAGTRENFWCFSCGACYFWTVIERIECRRHMLTVICSRHCLNIVSCRNFLWEIVASPRCSERITSEFICDMSYWCTSHLIVVCVACWTRPVTCIFVFRKDNVVIQDEITPISKFDASTVAHNVGDDWHIRS